MSGLGPRASDLGFRGFGSGYGSGDGRPKRFQLCQPQRPCTAQFKTTRVCPDPWEDLRKIGSPV